MTTQTSVKSGLDLSRIQTYSEPNNIKQVESAWAEGRFQLAKINSAYYRIEHIGHPNRVLHVISTNPSPKCRLELTGGVSELDYEVEHVKWEQNKLPSIKVLDTRHSGFHLQQIAPDAVDLVFGCRILNFRVSSGYPDTDIVIIETL